MKLTIRGNGVDAVRDFDTPQLLSSLLAAEHAPLPMPCGGRGICRKCRVTVKGGAAPMGEAEAALLSDDEKAAGVRYACMTLITGDAEVTLPEAGSQSIQTAGELPDFPLDPWAEGYGAVFDIGTTTVAAYLCSLSDGRLLASASAPNPQAAFGADVITRITHALDGGGAALADSIREALSALLARMCSVSGISADAVGAIVLTGNTAMEYFLTGSDPSSIARAPFIQDRYFGEYCKADALSLGAPHAEAYITRCISAYVGGDITSGILSSDMLSDTTPVLLADIGTNGELALWANGRLLCCSTAAGPALEGAGIHMGMTASEGAISHVRAEDGVLRWETIGGAAPVGICGTGIIDAIAAALALGYIDETGAIDDLSLPDEVYREVDGMPAILFPGTSVVITQKDVRAVQLAKSAIRAGIETLLTEAGLRAQEVGRLLIAGGFGTVLRVGSAAAIGLIPPALEARAAAIGNAAGMGGVMQLLSRPMLKKAEDLSRSAETVELSTSPVFQEAYIENMLFPEQQ